jgi:hypothetical protein
MCLGNSNLARSCRLQKDPRPLSTALSMRCHPLFTYGREARTTRGRVLAVGRGNDLTDHLTKMHRSAQLRRPGARSSPSHACVPCVKSVCLARTGRVVSASMRGSVFTECKTSQRTIPLLKSPDLSHLPMGCATRSTLDEGSSVGFFALTIFSKCVGYFSFSVGYSSVPILLVTDALPLEITSSHCAHCSGVRSKE